MMDRGARIYVAGHRGLVGSAIVRSLQGEGYRNLVLRTSKELDLRQQWLFFWLAVTVLFASLLLHVGPTGEVQTPVFRVPLPDSCTFRRLSGYDCPGCGLTRSFVSFAHGDWRGALQYNPAGPLWFGVMLAQIPYRGWQIRRLHGGKPAIAWRPANWLVWIALGFLFVQWIIRMEVIWRW